MTAEEALAHAARFGIATAGATARELHGGYSNEVWRIDAADRSVTVRRYGTRHGTHESVAFEHAVMDHASAGMPEVVAPLRDAEGMTIHASGGRFVAVLPWIAGTTGRRDTAAAVRAARLAARFHREIRTLHVRGGLRSARLLGTLPWLLEQFKRYGAPGSPVERALPWNDLLLAVSASVARVLPRAGRLPHVIVHGDLNTGNVVQADGKAVGLIDFDFAHESERIVDIGGLLDEFGRDHDDAPLDFSRVPALIAAYAADAPLTADERELLPDMMLLHALTVVAHVVQRHGERTPGDVGDAPRYVGRALEIAKNVERLGGERSSGG